MREYSLMAIALVAWHMLGACVMSVSYDDTAFLCEETPLCPEGYECVDGVCEEPTSRLPDATVADATTADAAPAADSQPPATDAATEAPDATPAPTQTLTFGENADDDVRGVTTDTYLEQQYEDDNFGARSVLKMDGDPYQVTLLRFDVSAIPAGSDVLDARLVVWTLDDPLEDGSIQVFRVLEPWDEGDHGGSPGVANYNLRQPATAWTAAGVGPGSRGAVILADFVPDATDTRWETALAPGAVQTWVDDPSANRGLVFTPSSGTARGCKFHSRESAESFRRPRLVVTFRP